MDTAVCTAVISIVDNSTWKTPVAPKFTCLLDHILVTSQPRTKLILPFTTMASSGGDSC